MKKFLFSVALVALVITAAIGQQKSGSNIIHLNNDQFKKLIFNYEVNQEWKYLGTKPAIIDFYADWCGPCRTMSPRLEEISREYEGKIIVYKVNTDKEQLLSAKLGIQSLPTIVFIPRSGKPQATMGAMPKDALVKAINEVLLVK